MFLKQFDDLADQVIEAIIADAANPDIRASIQNQLDRFASGLIGRDVNSPLIKPFWNNICENADRLYRAMKMRQAGCLPYSGCNPVEFQCVVGFDPVRITILSDLPLSVYCPSVTTTINRITSRSVDGTTTATIQTTTHEME